MNQKKIAGEKAVEYVADGMTIGLGTGSTVYWTIRNLGELVRSGLRIQGVATSRSTEEVAKEFGIALIALNDVSGLDLTIDGADEIDSQLDMIKGGGGALLREKMVAEASKRLIIVADESKLVKTLGAFPLPVEIVQFGWEKTKIQIEKFGLTASLRMAGENPFVTDNANYILDCKCSEITDPEAMHQKIKSLTGVVETGLFVNLASTAIIAGADGIKIIERSSK